MEKMNWLWVLVIFPKNEISCLMYKCNFKAIEFPKEFQHKKQEPLPNIKWLSMFAHPEEEIVSTGNLACISFMFRSSWFHLKRRGSVREPGTEALSRSRSSFVSNLPPRRATCLQTPPGPFKKVAQGKSTRKKKKQNYEKTQLWFPGGHS